MLKVGNDHFEATHLQPKVDVCGRRYVFDAQAPPHATVAPVFDPNAQCPAYVVNPKIAQAALAKQRADDLEYMQLVKDDVPVAPIYSGLDGGMNGFDARYPWKIVPLAIVLKPGSGSNCRCRPFRGPTRTVHWPTKSSACCPRRKRPRRRTLLRPTPDRVGGAEPATTELTLPPAIKHWFPN